MRQGRFRWVFRGRSFCVAGMTAGCLAGGGIARGAITTSGYVDPAAPADGQDVYIGRNDPTPQPGSLTIDGGSTLNSGWAVIADYNTGSSGSALVRGGTWTSSVSLLVGNWGTGTLTIDQGGRVVSPIATIGWRPGSSGTVAVDGAGSKWTWTPGTGVGTLHVGLDGSGTLNITNGGEVSSWAGTVGFGGSSVAVVNISGAGSKWANTQSVSLGHGGNATVTVSQGGAMSNTYAYIGDASAPVPASVKAEVTFDGGSWTNTSNVVVAFTSPGTMTIRNDSTVSALGLTVGRGARGVATIDHSAWSNGASGDVVVGDMATGSGELTLRNGASLTGRFGIIAAQTGASGTVRVDGSSWALSKDLVIGYRGPGTLILTNGATVSTGTAGQVSPGAVLDLSDTSSLSAPQLFNYGTVLGEGTLTGAVTNYATVSPGHSAGRLAVTGSYAQAAGGTLLIEVGPGGSDSLAVSGAASFGGTLTVQLADGYTPPVGATFDVLDFGSRSGQFATLSLPALPADRGWDTSSLYTTGVLAVVAPEPGSAALALVAGATALGTRRRRR